MGTPGLEYGAAEVLENTPDNRKQALSLHPAGRLGAGRAAYEALAAATPDDADLIGLPAAVALEQREFPAAMIFPHPTHGVSPDLAMPPEPLERIFAAFHDLVAQRIAEGAG